MRPNLLIRLSFGAILLFQAGCSRMFLNTQVVHFRVTAPPGETLGDAQLHAVVHLGPERQGELGQDGAARRRPWIEGREIDTAETAGVRSLKFVYQRGGGFGMGDGSARALRLVDEQICALEVRREAKTEGVAIAMHKGAEATTESGVQFRVEGIESPKIESMPSANK